MGVMDLEGIFWLGCLVVGERSLGSGEVGGKLFGLILLWESAG